MALSPVLFDFAGATSTGGQFGSNAVHTTTVFAENNVSFSFSSTKSVAVYDTSVNDYDSPGSNPTTAPAIFAQDAVAGNAEATLQIVDTNTLEQFLLDPNVQLSSHFVSGVGNLTVSFINTAAATTLVKKTVLTGSHFFTNVGYKTLSATGVVNKIKFTYDQANFMVHGVNGTVACFLAGTAIETPDGETPVEDLAEGDLVCTADGGQSRVKWVARSRVDTRLSHPAKVNPICIRAGALGDGSPRRDLFLSADHAIEIDGVLYNAGALANGRSIYRVAEMPLDGFSYYHVETERHELILADGVPSESYIDYAPRAGFDNAHEAPSLETVREMQMTRVSAPRLVPEALQRRLLARAEDAGLAPPVRRRRAAA